jgi:hypothetical protein
MSKPLDEIVHALGAFIAALAPAAIGSAVAQAWEDGLSWSQRVVQWAVGICVSYYVTGGLDAWLHLDRFVTQSISFVLAMVAFKATPKFTEAVVQLAGSIPAAIAQRVGLAKQEDSQ